ncbi:hypothetical protein FACS1894113_0730 [Alphaproteobacteria bacterium]|nr:hypothetical protein FACS1894113_0730 [Alphaproteobacteria bacterium]
MNTIIEKSQFRALDIAVLKWHLRLETSLEDEYLSRIIDMPTEVFENKTGKSILKKKYRYVCNEDYSSKICLPMQPVIEICSVKSPDKKPKFESKAEYIIVQDAELPVDIEYIAGICDDPEKVPKDI